MVFKGVKLIRHISAVAPRSCFINVFDKIREVFTFSGAWCTPNGKFSLVEKHSVWQREWADWSIALSPYCQGIVETTSFWSWKSGLECPKSKNSKIVSRYAIVLSKTPKLIEIGSVVAEMNFIVFFGKKTVLFLIARAPLTQVDV